MKISDLKNINYEDVKNLPIFLQVIAVILSVALALFLYKNMFLVLLFGAVVYIILMPSKKKVQPC